MSKELEKEYLEDLDHYDEGMGIHSTSYKKCKERLIRLAQIDSANPSQALECLGSLRQECKSTYFDENRKQWWTTDKNKDYRCNTIEQALLKAQEQEKVLEIIEKKEVDVFRLKKLDFNTFNQLQKSCNLPELTQEEFELLKRSVE